MKELNELRTNPPEGIRVVTNEDNMLDVTGIIEGPGEWLFTLGINAELTISITLVPLPARVAEGTPYAGGYFKVRFSFTSEFPAAPPKCKFSAWFSDANSQG